MRAGLLLFVNVHCLFVSAMCAAFAALFQCALLLRTWRRACKLPSFASVIILST
jgi:hypothetical protein